MTTSDSRSPASYLILVLLLGGALVTQVALPERIVAGVQYSATSLVPALVTLLLAVMLRNVLVALLIGVVVGAVTTQGLGGLAEAAQLYAIDNVTDGWHLCIAGFALCTLGLIRMLEASGATQTVLDAVTTRVRTPRGAQLGTAVAGLVVFFDDYANTFIVGSSMQPIADRYRVSREKLAYLVDSTAAPVAGLAILSTWIAYEAGLLQEIGTPLGLTLDGYSLVLAALPLRFYSLFSLATVFLVIALGRDVEPMLGAERKARLGEAAVAPAPPRRRPLARALLVTALPLTALLGGVLVGYAIDGYHETPLPPLSLPWFRAYLKHADHGEVSLLAAAVVATVLAFGLLIATRMLSAAHAARGFARGVRGGAAPIALLFGAWALGAISKDAGTGVFLVASLEGRLPLELLAVATFLVSGLVAFATGSSWGTMAIVLPAAVPLAATQGESGILFATIAAVMDGAIFGDHCSPLSDTTLLSATACHCDSLTHTATQLPYAAACFVAAAVAYLGATTLLISSGWLLAAGVVGLAVWLRVFGKSPEPASLKAP